MKLVSKVNGAASFAELVGERIAVERELREANTMQGIRLTREAYAAAAMKIAGTSAERLVTLRTRIESDRRELDEVKASLRRMMLAIRGPHYPYPPGELRRLNFAMTADSLALLVGLGSSTFELNALASMLVAERWPESFGTCTDTQAHQRRYMELLRKSDEMKERIPSAITGDDLDFNDGTAPPTIKGTNGAVPLAPRDTLAERIAGWMLMNQQNP